ncbi:MAG: DUF1003 domain-containing protein [Roseiflexaceae bacterium]
MAQVQPQDAEPDHPPLSDVIERNIQSQVRLRIETLSRRTFQERISDAITAFSGSLSFAYLHALWFGLWVLLNTGRFGIRPFDPFPYSLLTMIVSLEAIFLSTFVLISQNRSGAEADRRADLALHVGLLTEHEVTRALQMLDAIQERLGVASDPESDLAQLETETKPEDVLAEIQRLRRLEHPHRR